MAQPTFQNQVQKVPVKGMPGDKATLNPHVYTDRNFLSGDASVTVGNFVWEDPSSPAAYHGSGIMRAISSSASAVQPLGIVERNLTFGEHDVTVGASLALPENANLSIVKRGDLYAVSATAAVKGHKVFAVLADGSLKTGTAGATLAGAVETAFEVVEGGASGELITISNWSA